MIEEASDQSVEEGAGDRALDDVFEVLSDRRRRHLLYRLRAREEPVPLPELARAVVAVEEGIDRGAVTGDQCQRAYLDLYHTQVPYLVEQGIVSYDPEDGTVTLTGLDDRLATYVDEAMAEEDVIGEPIP